MLRNKKVLVTGGSGFIGGRLVEKLILEEGAEVRALVRNFSTAVRLARFDLSMIRGEIVDCATVEEAVKDCDTVFHCAYDFRDAEKNLQGARVLGEACLRAGVRRLVHVSTVAVYEAPLTGDMDEHAPAAKAGWEYANNKLAVEQLLLQLHAEYGLPLVVIQPTIVFGPFGGAWTITPVKRLRNERLVLPRETKGLCNFVYIDDVVEAMILAAKKDQAVGERFLISGPTPVTWTEFYRAYERILNVSSIVLMDAGELEKSLGGRGSKIKMLRRDPRRLLQIEPVHNIYRLVRDLIGKDIRARARKALPSPLNVPDSQRLSLLRAESQVKSDKARRILGYEPAFDFERGMKLTAEYIAWANL